MKDHKMAQSPQFNLDSYVYQLSEDLDQYAAFLHRRDVANFLRFNPTQPTYRRNSAPEFNTWPKTAHPAEGSKSDYWPNTDFVPSQIKSEPLNLIERDF